jgi:hypothetical protein
MRIGVTAAILCALVGRAMMRVRLMQTGMRRVVAWKRTYRRGAAHVRIVR